MRTLKVKKQTERERQKKIQVRTEPQTLLRQPKKSTIGRVKVEKGEIPL